MFYPLNYGALMRTILPELAYPVKADALGRPGALWVVGSGVKVTCGRLVSGVQVGTDVSVGVGVRVGGVVTVGSGVKVALGSGISVGVSVRVGRRVGYSA